MFDQIIDSSVFKGILLHDAVCGTRICSILLFTLILGGCSSAPTHANALAGRAIAGDRPIGSGESPRLLLEKTSYDLGRIKLGSAAMAVFRLSNRGKGLLRISDVRKCCGAVVKVEKTELGPGDKGVLTVEYEVNQAPGALNKKITLVSNDPENPQMELTITGEVIQTLGWTPARIAVRTFEQSVKCPDIVIRSLDGISFSIKGFASTDNSLRLTFDPNSRATEFILKPVPDAAKLRRITTPNGRIMIYLDHPDYQVVNLSFDVIQALQSDPPQILLFDAKAGEPVVRAIRVQDNQVDPNAIALIGVESVRTKNGGRVEVRGVTAKKAAYDLELEIWPAAGKESESFSSDQLVVKLKDGRELAVPVRVFYQSPAVSSAVGQGSDK